MQCVERRLGPLEGEIGFHEKGYLGFAPVSGFTVASMVAVAAFTGDSALFHAEAAGVVILVDCFIKPDMESIRTYWDENDSFQRDHYVFSLDRQWIIRLDQDTTLFMGELDFMRSVVERLGGVSEVRTVMDDDFIGGFDDVVGLGDYIDGLLAPLS